MKPCKADLVRINVVRMKTVRNMIRTNMIRIGPVLLFLLATVPAYCQRGTFGVDVGQISDHFAGFSPVTDALVDINGELTVKGPSPKNGGPSIVAGGEIRFPTDTNLHAKEFALYGGLMFGVGNFSIGVDAQVRRIYMPPAVVGDQVFNRDNLELVQIPLVVRYKFGPSKHAFFEARGEPEFKPHYLTNASTSILPSPGFDHGYTVKGSVGYKFGQWYYVKGSYETRYFKFATTPGNPNDLYNWKSNVISGGVGLTF